MYKYQVSLSAHTCRTLDGFVNDRLCVPGPFGRIMRGKMPMKHLARVQSYRTRSTIVSTQTEWRNFEVQVILPGDPAFKSEGQVTSRVVIVVARTTSRLKGDARSQFHKFPNI